MPPSTRAKVKGTADKIADKLRGVAGRIFGKSRRRLQEKADDEENRRLECAADIRKVFGC